jgi:hypothetical protein
MIDLDLDIDDEPEPEPPKEKAPPKSPNEPPRNTQASPEDFRDELMLASCCMGDSEGRLFGRADHLPVEAFESQEVRAVWRAMKEGFVFAKDEAAFERAAGLSIARLLQIETMAGLGTGFTEHLRVLQERWRAREYLSIAAQMVKTPDMDPNVAIKRLEALKEQHSNRESDGFAVWKLPDFENYTPPIDDVILGEAGGVAYWRDHELMLLLGPGGVGKSRINLQLAVSQILSREFLGFMTFGPPRRWLLMGNENSVERYKKELALMLAGATEEERKLVSEYLLI